MEMRGQVGGNMQQTSTLVSFDGLLASLEWASAAPPCENEPYVRRVTGKIFWSSGNNGEEELPADIEDGTA